VQSIDALQTGVALLKELGRDLREHGVGQNVLLLDGVLGGLGLQLLHLGLKGVGKAAGDRLRAVPGEAGGGSHAWNYVKDGSSYRYIDVTWDDPVQDQGAKAAVK